MLLHLLTDRLLTALHERHVNNEGQSPVIDCGLVHVVEMFVPPGFVGGGASLSVPARALNPSAAINAPGDLNRSWPCPRRKRICIIGVPSPNKVILTCAEHLNVEPAKRAVYLLSQDSCQDAIRMLQGGLKASFGNVKLRPAAFFTWYCQMTWLYKDQDIGPQPWATIC
jgi:hypothetical protein